MENISDVDDLQTQIIRGGGQYIIDQYQKNKMLTDRSRIQLVNIVANVFYEKYGSAVPKSVKMECAKKLVEIFPMYKNLESSTRGYEIFFNPSTNGGYLANRLRTLNRINEIERNNPPVKHLHDQNVSITSEEMNLTEELQENLDILKAIPSSETNKIKSLFFETFEYRKSLINKGSAMEIFPKFHETVGLISLPLMETIEKTSNNQPYIIAKGKSKLLLEEFLIALDGKLLPDVFTTFEDSVNYLMKVHFVFQVKYDSSLENLYKFIQVYFYNIDTENVLFNSAILKLKCQKFELLIF
ncbi:uncharacterized protein isoform X3 [Leptinotarsa decemlineata]